ncbi:hypothetical protein N869_13775 [Cellulomonas bogoriensis 69B4 = DSM 16987]|uniref:Tse2 ADP-ribosyltransferase toxin domain-containing protein n=2 Tax=Cellulomonas bogoriensis TaxID=301388 RepID=A0A0A0C0I3_9CELL|nr:hypothetical protein N869_13775 [Cellulomonas bogoriensis 69B4 = DSM 16987]
MRPAAPGPGPLAQDNNANALGVRVNSPPAPSDVETYMQNEVPWVNPLTGDGSPQGVSVATGSGCNLPTHRRPKGAPWNGTGANGLLMWELDDTVLVPAQLRVVAAPLPEQPEHAVISPAVAMSLHQYRQYIASTQLHWEQSAEPVPHCAPGAVLEGGRAVHAHVDALVAAVAGGDDPGELIEALRAQNAAGTSAPQIVAHLEAAAVQADSQGNDDGAEALRGVLDRISGYCAPAHRIVLT